MEDKQHSPEENVLIKINNQIANEKVLLPIKDINLLVFQCLFICFGSALIIQIVSIVPVSYRIRDFSITLVLFIFAAFVIFLILNKKVPTLKFYLFFAALLVGLIIGV